MVLGWRRICSWHVFVTSAGSSQEFMGLKRGGDYITRLITFGRSGVVTEVRREVMAWIRGVV